MQKRAGKALVVTTVTVAEPIQRENITFSNLNLNISDNNLYRVAQLIAQLKPGIKLQSVVVRDDFDIE
ncbi:DUF1659 domain-containing protein [Lacticaseibacillus hegangensis]|uniref:DUF1659 domain-containing protein n=1 Tax=Lacticaseibacillus hegangensis TaxID=2486010 RepID=A0ABW4CZ47_9LACO|nr:hypothetical protein [Lacticaseibacillus hegangensis]